TAGHREQQGEFTGWRKYFNSYTPQGRRNVCTVIWLLLHTYTLFKPKTKV
uniref:Uncharacterized protein n=1 Tax=Periophthalmus magnuspinnatus TaxID=409849 RepID=A0A3B3ZD22_9GOBI